VDTEVAAAYTQIGPIYDQLMAAVPYRAWVDYVELLVRRHGGRPRRVLDLACGTGNVGLEFARRGYQVTGVDRSASMLQEAIRKAQEQNLPVSFFQQDMRELRLPEYFDLVVCLYDSLNYLLEWEGLRQTLCGVHACLQPGGLFIFDLNTELALAMNLFTQRNLDPKRPVRYDWRSEYNPQTRICRVDMTFYVDHKEQTETLREVHYERAYTQREVRQALRAAKLELLAMYDAYTFHRPTEQSDRIYYVARRDPFEAMPL